MSVKVAILAVGTELTSGEISNGNAVWLSERLEDLGFEVGFHVVVPDHRQLIENSLEWLEPQVDLLLVTGGLGPTSDDFTREVLAQWSKSALEFKDLIWQQMNELYLERGLTIRPAHRQQCYFPQNSTLIHNTVGTAHGFYFKQGRSLVVALPGPPAEIQGMWESEVLKVLAPLSPTKQLDLRTWTCFNVTESEAAEVTEQVIEKSGMQVGYRASVPYVKVKLWVPRQNQKASEVVKTLDRALAKWVVARDQADPLDPLLLHWSRQPLVHVVDGLTEGRLSSRILGQGFEKRNLSNLVLTSGVGLGEELHSHSPPSYWIKSGAGASQFEVGWGLHRETLALPFRLTTHSRRGSLYVAESAILWWTKAILAQQS